MATQRKKVKKARSTASTWKTKTGGKAAFSEDLELPSGNVALVRRVGPELFLKQGLVPDPLTSMVERAVRQKKGLPPEKVQNMLSDPSKIGAVFEMMDRILCYAVLEPAVRMPPCCTVLVEDRTATRDDEDEPVVKSCNRYFTDSSEIHTKSSHVDYHVYVEGPREDDVLYSDMVDINDKMFIMNYAVGGTRDFERFRNERQSSVAELSIVENLES